MSKKTDINGYWTYDNVPITREGVFMYKGRQVDSDGSMGLDPDKKYPVYRPASEITNPRTLKSFDAIPITDNHLMLGDGQRDVGSRRIDGICYNVHVDPKDPGVVLASLKIMSNAMKNLIESGKRALSCGYYCDYKPARGTFKGQPYDFIQHDLTGNHLALVKKGRMGEKCAIMDSADNDSSPLKYALDAAELTDQLQVTSLISQIGQTGSLVRKGLKFASDSAIDIQTKGTFMPTENYDEMLAKALEGKGVKDKVNIEKIIEFIGTLPAASAEPAKDAEPTPAPAEGEPVAPAAAEPAPAPVAEPTAAPAVEPTPAPAAEPVKDADEPTPAPEAAPAEAPAPTAVTKEEFQAAVDAAVAERYAREDEGRQLAEDIAPKCGNLWKRGMDADDVAEAACEKLGHKDLPKEARIPFLKAVATEEEKKPAGDKTACDSAFDAPTGKTSTMLKYLGK